MSSFSLLSLSVRYLCFNEGHGALVRGFLDQIIMLVVQQLREDQIRVRALHDWSCKINWETAILDLAHVVVDRVLELVQGGHDGTEGLNPFVQ